MTELLPIALLIASPFIGSFLGLVADRLPGGEGLVLGRSRCDHCAAALAPFELIPLLGWVISRGRCRHCGQAISLRHPAIELGAFAVALWSVLVLPGWLALAGCLLGWTLLTLSVIDARTLLIPDLLSLPLIVAGLALAALLPTTGVWDHVIGALVGAALVVVLALGYRRLRAREGIGLGDAKLLAAAGAWVGWQGLGSVVLLAAVSALLVVLAGRLKAGRLAPDQPIPFGPFLALGFWITWLYGPLGFGAG